MAYVYTEQEFNEIKQKYVAGISVESLAADYGKSVASVRMKLVKAGIYVKKTAKSAEAKSEIKTAATEYKVPSGKLTKAQTVELKKFHQDLLYLVGEASF